MASRPDSPVKMAAIPKLEDADPVDRSRHYPSIPALRPSMATEGPNNRLTIEPQGEPAMEVVTATQETLEVNDAAAPSQPSINDNEPGESSDPTMPPKEPAEETPTIPQKTAKCQQTPPPTPSTPSRPTEAVCHSHSISTIQISTLCPGEQGEGTVTAPKRSRSPSTSPTTSLSVLNTISIDFHLPQQHPQYPNSPTPSVHVVYQFHAPPRTPTKTSRASSPTVDALQPRIKRLNIQGRAGDNKADTYSARRPPVETPPSRQHQDPLRRRHAPTHREPSLSMPSTHTYRSSPLSDRKATASRHVPPTPTQSTPRSVPHMRTYTSPQRRTGPGLRFPVVGRLGRHPVRAPAGRPAVRERGGGRRDDGDVFTGEAGLRDDRYDR